MAIVFADGTTFSTRGWSSGVAWSTIKVPLAIAALRAGVSVPIDAAITHSDNAVAEELWSALGDDAALQVQAVIREAGDANTVVESRRLRPGYTPFGQTQWSLLDQARFAAGLGGVAGSARVLELMGALCEEHTWGLAARGFAAKGGWGPSRGEDYLVRQFGIVPHGSGVAGIALAAVLDRGYDIGVEMIDTMAKWALERLARQ
ncbi:hypothetical protein [Candidatus Mycobacterium wuenschmannii]